ncbi:MAG: hypothetical protein GY713_02875 [Actinomycetia bacterium]|nr:hypothetical protein [Actinomycetes bacterium]
MRRRRNTVSTAGVIVAVLVAALLGPVTPAPAGATANASISGTVTDLSSGLPVADASVQVSGLHTPSNGWAVTAADGTYLISGLNADQYRITAHVHGEYLRTYYPGTTDGAAATRLLVSDGVAHSGVDIALDPGATIEGVVSEADGGLPLEGVLVQAAGQNNGGSGQTYTTADGSYTLTGLNGDSYLVDFRPDTQSTYRTEWYDGVFDRSLAAPVVVADGGSAVGINADLDIGATMSGTITDAGTGLPVAGAGVVAGQFGSTDVGSAVTAADGAYTVEGLGGGEYYVYFSSPAHFSEYYDGASGLFSYTPVLVPADGSVVGIDADLDQAAVISGVVTDSVSGLPLPGIAVTVNGAGFRIVTTASDGSYEVSGLRAGDYVVSFEDQAAPPAHAMEFYDNAPDAGTATTVAAMVGVPAVVDAALDPMGTVSGMVTDDLLAPLGGISVRLVGALGGTLEGVTAPDGTFAVAGVPADDYLVSFDDPAGTYRFEYYDDVLTEAAATPVTVPVAGTLTGIDADLTTAASIVGVVTDSISGLPIPGALVTVNELTSGHTSQDYSGPDGTYRIGGLAGGSYQLHAQPGSAGGYVPEWYDDTIDQAAATPVVVAVATEVSAPITLDPFSVVEGTVTDEFSAAPLAGISVSVTGPGSGGATITGADGTYSIAVPPDTYTVQFQDPSLVHSDEWFDNAPDQATATPVVVDVTSTVSNIDAALAPGGSISGTVTEEGTGVPLAGIDVWANTPGLTHYTTTTTAADGTYTLTGLPPDTYRVGFYDSSSPGHVYEYYVDAADFLSATDIPVVGPVTGIDAALAPAGSISGTIFGDDTGLPVSGPVFELFDLAGVSVRSAGAGDDGTYVIAGLPAGDYRLQFRGGNGSDYVAEWYDDAPDQASATILTVVAGVELTNTDGSLPIGGSVSGIVTEDGTGAPLDDVQVQVSAVVGTFSRLAVTAADGSYTVSGLPAGSYRVWYSPIDGRHLSEWYDDVTSRFSATPILVSLGVDTPNIDGSLASAGTISGVVDEDETGLPLAGVTVWLWRAGSYAGSTRTDASGSYTVGSLAADTYTVSFTSLDHHPEYYDDAPDLDSATWLVVGAGDVITSIDASLAPTALGVLTLVEPCVLYESPVGVPLNGGQTVPFSAVGSCGVPADARGVQVVVTATDPLRAGNLRLSPNGVPPSGGVVNFAANALDNSNMATVATPAGWLDLSVNGGGGVTAPTTGARVAVVGWYGSPDSPGASYHPITPCTAGDSRPGQGPTGGFVGPHAVGTTLSYLVEDAFPTAQGGGNTTCGIPASATGVLVNIVAVNPSGTGTIAAGPSSVAATEPFVSFASLVPTMNSSTAVSVPLNSAGELTLVVDGEAGVTVHTRVVVLGYYQPEAPGDHKFSTVVACAVFDTRAGRGATGGAVGPRTGGSVTTYRVAGMFSSEQGGGNSDCGVPADASAVAINLVAVNPTRAGNLRVSASGVAPSGGVVNFAPLSPAMSNSNTVVVPLSLTGLIDIGVNGGAPGAGLPVTEIRGVIVGYYR